MPLEFTLEPLGAQLKPSVNFKVADELLPSLFTNGTVAVVFLACVPDMVFHPVAVVDGVSPKSIKNRSAPGPAWDTAIIQSDKKTPAKAPVCQSRNLLNICFII